MDSPRAELEPRWKRTESGFDDWVAMATERADPFMAWLGVLFALLVGYDIATDPTGSTSEVLSIASWAIWAIFVFEFLVKVWLAPRRATYVRRHWWQLILLAIPLVRIFSFLRLMRLGRALPASRVLSSSVRASGTAKLLLRSRLGYLAALASIGTVAVAEAVYVFERDLTQGVFDNFGEAFLWAVTTVVALQADPVPESTGARIVMVVGLVIGLIVVASLAGVVGSFLIEARDEQKLP